MLSTPNLLHAITGSEPADNQGHIKVEGSGPKLLSTVEMTATSVGTVTFTPQSDALQSATAAETIVSDFLGNNTLNPGNFIGNENLISYGGPKSIVVAQLTAVALIPPVATEGQALQTARVPLHRRQPAGVASDYSAVTTLGDGNTVTLTSAASRNGQIVAHGDGAFDVKLTYTYAEELSNQTFSVKVTDDGGQTTQASTSTFSVADAPLTAGTSFELNKVIFNGSDFSGIFNIAPNDFFEPIGGGVRVQRSGPTYWARRCREGTQIYIQNHGLWVANGTNLQIFQNLGIPVIASVPLDGTLQDFSSFFGLPSSTVEVNSAAQLLTPPLATEGQAFTNVPVFHFTDANPLATASDYWRWSPWVTAIP